MTSRKIFSFICFILLVSSCQNKVDGVPIDDELLPYYEIFRIAAEERGIIFDNSVERIEGYIQNIPDSGVLGACRRGAEDQDSPQIFFDKPYWRTATELEREYVVFHEFGHCFLNLGHDDDSDDKGDCISIMASGLGDCRSNFNSLTREEYLDELFSK